MTWVSPAVKWFVVLAVLALAPMLRASELTGTVVGVADGDTITLLTPAKERVRVRLHGIDAPESRQPFGAAAKKALSERVFRKEVRVEVVDTDRYGRTVGRVFLGDVDVGLEQVRAGMAWWYARYAANDETLRDAEAEARDAKRGLWSEKDPVPPLEWRASGRERK